MNQDTYNSQLEHIRAVARNNPCAGSHRWKVIDNNPFGYDFAQRIADNNRRAASHILRTYDNNPYRHGPSSSHASHS